MWNHINAGTHFGDALRVSHPSAERLKSPTLHAVPQSGLMLQTARVKGGGEKEKLPGDGACVCVCVHPGGVVTSPFYLFFSSQNGNGRAY